jgi:hypothetical protein
MFDLRGARLPYVDEGSPLNMRWFYLVGITHRCSPVAEFQSRPL